MVCFVTRAAPVWPLRRPEWREVKRPDWRRALVIVALRAVGRWPSWFVTRQLDPDENQFIAEALTLRHDPILWRSADGMTSGPIDYCALMPVGWPAGANTDQTATTA